MTTALLLMDFQNGIAGRTEYQPAVAAAEEALASARSQGMPVIFVRVGFRPGFPEVAESNLRFSSAKRSNNPGMYQDSDGTQILDSMRPRPEEPVVLKKRISAFAGSDLQLLLRGLEVDSLVMAGVSTSGVVLSTLRYASDLDFRLTVLSDACADSDPEVHRVLTQKVFPVQAEVMTTEQWVAQSSE